MPLDREDAYFGSKKGSANKALQAMIKQYGLKKGTQVFYSLLNDRKRARKTYGRHGRRA